MTGSANLCVSYSPRVGNKKIKISDGSLFAIAGKGSISLSPSITLHDVLYVPNLAYNLLSVSWFMILIVRAHFYSSHCEFQDLTSGRMIGNVRQQGSLYFFEEGSDLGGQNPSTCFNFISVYNHRDVMLWHLRLGYPSFHNLKILLPSLFINKNPSLFECEICELAKHHHISFPMQPYKPSEPFSLIHSDTWGPSQISTFSGKGWFVTFIDDHTRLT